VTEIQATEIPLLVVAYLTDGNVFQLTAELFIILRITGVFKEFFPISFGHFELLMSALI